jgi:hypothetical protein
MPAGGIDACECAKRHCAKRQSAKRHCAAPAFRGCTCAKMVLFAQVQRSGDATPVRRDFGFRLAAARAVVLCNFHAVPP